MPTYEIENVPVSGGLLPNELKERETTLLADFAKSTHGYAEMVDGFAFKLEPNDAVLRLLSEFIIAESQCYSFFQFRLITLQQRREVWLEIRGPSETKALLHELLPASAFANAIK